MVQKSPMFIVLPHRWTKKVGSSTSYQDALSTVVLSAKKLKLANDSDCKENEIMLMWSG